MQLSIFRDSRSHPATSRPHNARHQRALREASQAIHNNSQPQELLAPIINTFDYYYTHLHAEIPPTNAHPVSLVHDFF